MLVMIDPVYLIKQIHTHFVRIHEEETTVGFLHCRAHLPVGGLVSNDQKAGLSIPVNLALCRAH